MPDTTHLELRGRTWWYIRGFPKALRHKLPMPHRGRAKYMVNLQTSDLLFAQRSRPQLNAQFDALLASARKRKVGIGEELLIDEAKDLRFSISNDPDGSTRQELALERAEELQKSYGDELASKFYKTATEQKDGTDIDEHLEAFIAKHPAVAYTNYKRRKAVEILTLWRSALYVESITLSVAREFVDKSLSPGRSPETINAYLTPLVSYWKWMIDQELVKGVANPWPRLRPKKEKREREDEKRAFTSDEMERLFRGPKKMRTCPASALLRQIG
jgi:hypothetical protein